jgi:hypothetical protein
MYAKCAFICVAIRMNESRIVGTGGKTCLAADAQGFVHQYHSAEIVDVACACRAAVDARRAVALIAPLASNLHVEGWIRSGYFLHDPITIESLGNLILGFASNDAIHATDAFQAIDNHRESCHD